MNFSKQFEKWTLLDQSWLILSIVDWFWTCKVQNPNSKLLWKSNTQCLKTFKKVFLLGPAIKFWPCWPNFGPVFVKKWPILNIQHSNFKHWFRLRGWKDIRGQSWRLKKISFQLLYQNQCLVPHVKDLLHICLETKAQGFWVTSRVFNLG